MENEKRYTTGEEIVNAATHAVGALASIGGMILLLRHADTCKAAIAACIYAGSLFFMYLCSTLYHAVQNPNYKMQMRLVDHCMIYVLIAATYTPIILFVFSRGSAGRFLVGIWSIALFGIFYTLRSEKYNIYGTLFYLLMGWLALALVYELWTTQPHVVTWYFLAGGVVYTLGAVLYLIKRRYMHGVWHLFVMLGSLFHFIAIYKLYP